MIEEGYKPALPEKKYYCEDCGTEISRKSKGKCIECAHKAQRVCDRPSRQELKNLIRTLPFTEIGKHYGVTDNTIRKWCDKENLPRKKSDIVEIIDDEWQKI